ncbi:MAG: UDP-N-acetylmuramoyl-L-alanine--D-glutamate ligase [Candidatus Marinimicrobia bacterium]|nr:UDP-N-acetylmuramoyl-L-alanine--D-glutamate ligase [Candidatus Neomarinimicrobiota bacterium]MBL7023282.1 UDP-N-acetylmuramoyl-L-alanine--D-glutamate ligase [Candidatus Neomarinimicrobiota bacterium]MBL7108876.1 UDP-N-acetylmuramoyl-L-alanine--D-glutamate ligase [Candidatus Neomarinimicrobiota bacterium]
MIKLNSISTINWKDVPITILGAGKSGVASAHLAKFIGAKPFVSDTNDSKSLREKLSEFDFELGGHSGKTFNAELMILSPGIPYSSTFVQKFVEKDIPIVSEIEFASWFTSSPILAITGSNGKTTTTNLLHLMISRKYNNSMLGGNIGIPFSANVHYELFHSLDNVVHVLELSSFQLEHIYNFAPNIAGILNISPDHLDRYSDLNDYANTKLNITKNIRESDFVVYNADDAFLLGKLKSVKCGKPFSTHKLSQTLFNFSENTIFTSSDNVLVEMKETKLEGPHNIQNIVAASTMAKLFGINDFDIASAVREFSPIPHRLEFVAEIDCVKFYNDSKATNIASTIAGITSFDKNLIVILGGKDKGSTDFTELAPYMKGRVKSIITYGEAGEQISQQLKAEFPTTYHWDFSEAFSRANDIAQKGDTVLLSPACASFDQFDNYEHRGDVFKKLSHLLKEKCV